MTIKEKKFIVPTEFTTWTMPVVILSDDMRGFVPWVIKAHTSGNWNHSMIMVHKDFVVTQNNVLKELPITSYLIDGQLLKFWRVKGVSSEELEKLLTKVAFDLKQPWWKRSYDYLGIVGQALHLPWIQFPWAKFCSEHVAECLKLIKPGIPKEPDPSDLDVIFKSRPEDFELLGYWIEGGYQGLVQVSKKEEIAAAKEQIA